MFLFLSVFVQYNSEKLLLDLDETWQDW